MCQEPMIEALFPKFGPRSGGTQLSVHGRNLNIGSQLMVYASSRLCTVVRLQTHLVVDKIKNVKNVKRLLHLCTMGWDNAN